MAYFLDYLSGKLRPYKTIIIIVLVVIVFLAVGIYYGKTLMSENKKKTVKFKDVANNGNRSGIVEVRMFHVEWCPHCKKALPDWKAFCDAYDGKEVNGYTIKCDSNGDNCTDDKDETVQRKIKEFNIDSYPTIVLMKNDERYDFDAKITKESLDQFVHSVTNQ